MQVANITQANSSNQSSQGIITLPDNPLKVCFSYLTSNSLGMLCNTCHELRNRIQSTDSFWKTAARREFNIQNPFSNWTLRECVIIKKNWERNFSQERIIDSVITQNAFMSEPHDKVHFWNNRAFQSLDLFTMKKVDFKKPSNLENFECTFFDGNRALFIKTDFDLKNSEIHITDPAGKTLSHFYLKKHPIEFRITLIENTIVLTGSFSASNKVEIVGIHELPSNDPVLMYDQFTFFSGDLASFTKNQLMLVNDTQTIVYDLNQKKVIERISTPDNDISEQSIIQNILVQVTKNSELIGHKKEVIQEENNSHLEWVEIWRNRPFLHPFVYQPVDNCSHFFSKGRYETAVYDISTGKYNTRRMIDNKTWDFVVPRSRYNTINKKLINFNSYIYVNTKNQCVIKDFSPICKLPAKGKNLPTPVSTQTKSFFSFRKIAIFCLAIFSTLGLVYLGMNRKK
ncbi:MAG: hypothetical protein H0W88_09080 [Parachlamydiaceae bacterium]|nr:hypothetical protein [Parachlamydiaceae bacterium]